MYNIFPTILQLPISDLTAKAFPPSKRFLFLAWQGREQKGYMSGFPHESLCDRGCFAT